MRKISKKEAKKVVGGTTYKCRYCSYKTTGYSAYKNHMKQWHNVTV